MKKIFFLLLIPFFLFAYRVELKDWHKYETFWGFLKSNKIPLSLYYSFSKNIQKKLRFISANTTIYLLKNGNELRQALIPISNKKQLQLINNRGKWSYKIVPIKYFTERHRVTIIVNNFLSYDVFKKTHNPMLANKIVNIFSDRVNFRILPKNTKIELFYDTKSRFGKILNIDIVYARIQNRLYDIEAYKWTDGRYYDQNGRSLKGMFLSVPLRYKRISSKFGMRFHPILHRWRMHDGIDFVNRIGTPIHSVADGKVIFKGRLGGYGYAVKIKHRNGYITLYGHLHNFAHIRVGQWIKQGKVIGYLGNSGLSTGPHLHFGVMHNGKWINPLKIRKSAKIKLYGKRRKEFLTALHKFKSSEERLASK